MVYIKYYMIWSGTGSKLWLVAFYEARPTWARFGLKSASLANFNSKFQKKKIETT